MHTAIRLDYNACASHALCYGFKAGNSLSCTITQLRISDISLQCMNRTVHWLAGVTCRSPSLPSASLRPRGPAANAMASHTMNSTDLIFLQQHGHATQSRGCDTPDCWASNSIPKHCRPVLCCLRCWSLKFAMGRTRTCLIGNCCLLAKTTCRVCGLEWLS
jgi:hypothetical protein